MVDLWLGQQLRQLRNAQGKSLTQIAGACGVSVGTLSQIERGLSSLSIRMLHMVAAELGVPPDSLLRNAENPLVEASGRVQRAGSHRMLHLEDRGIVKEILTPPLGRSMDICMVSIEPGGSTGDDMLSIERGEHMGMVLEGTLELWIENEVILLHAGDSFCYASQSPRRWRNAGDVITRAIWAISNIAIGEKSS